MIKNKINDLRDHMFAQIENLAALDFDEPKDAEKLHLELKRSSAIAEIGTVIIESAKAEIKFIEVTNGDGTDFIPYKRQELGGGK